MPGPRARCKAQKPSLIDLCTARTRIESLRLLTTRSYAVTKTSNKLVTSIKLNLLIHINQFFVTDKNCGQKLLKINHLGKLYVEPVSKISYILFQFCPFSHWSRKIFASHRS